VVLAESFHGRGSGDTVRGSCNNNSIRLFFFLASMEAVASTVQTQQLFQLSPRGKNNQERKDKKISAPCVPCMHTVCTAA
jgi:hypothetical protein